MGNRNSSDALINEMCNLKLTAKQLVSQSKRCENGEKAERLKLKQAIEKGNIDGARIYAENAIRQKNQALNFLRLASRVDAVAARVETAVKMNTLNQSMSKVVVGMSRALASCNTEQISKTMDQFEKQFEDLDVQAQYVEQTMNTSTALSTPEDDVNSLMQQVADQYNLDLSSQLRESNGLPVAVSTPAANNKVPAAADDLSARFNQLKQRGS